MLLGKAPMMSSSGACQGNADGQTDFALQAFTVAASTGADASRKCGSLGAEVVLLFGTAAFVRRWRRSARGD